jgi:hypothetical protein
MLFSGLRNTRRGDDRDLRKVPALVSICAAEIPWCMLNNALSIFIFNS